MKYPMGVRQMQMREAAGSGVHRQNQCNCPSVSPIKPLLQDWGHKPVQNPTPFSMFIRSLVLESESDPSFQVRIFLHLEA